MFGKINFVRAEFTSLCLLSITLQCNIVHQHRSPAMHTEVLNEEEMEYLNELLVEYGTDDSILDVSELDGFFTALVTGPAEVTMEQWYPAIWGGAEVEPELESEEEAEQVEQLLQRMYQSLREQLQEDPEEFSALFYEGDFEGEAVTVVEEWCFGFMRGVKLGAWPVLAPAQTVLLDAIALHGDEENFPLLDKMTLDEHQNTIGDIEPAVRKLYAWFRA